MKRFEIIYYDDPHPSRCGKRYTVNVNGQAFLVDSKADCIKACAAYLADTDETAARPSVDAMISEHNVNVVKMVQRAMGVEI
jgi:hypothetical protein